MDIASRRISGAHVNITEDCNFRCRYCFAAHNPASMDWPTLMASIDWLLDRAGSGLHVTWFGGEPLLEADVMLAGADYLVAEGKRRGIQTSSGAVTNGSLLTPALVQRLREADIRLLYSYDGPHSQAELRGGDVEQIEGNLRQCLEARIPTNVAMQVAAGHTKHLATDYKHVRELGVAHVALNPVVHCYEPFTPEDWEQIAGALGVITDYEYDHMMAGSPCGYTQLSGQLDAVLRVARGQDLKGRRTDYACGACKGSLAIWPNGDITPCQQMSCAGGFEHWRLGNVHTGEFDEGLRQQCVTEAVDAWVDCRECGVLRCAPCRTVNRAVMGAELDRAPDLCRWQRAMYTEAVRLHNRLADAGYYAPRPREAVMAK